MSSGTPSGSRRMHGNPLSKVAAATRSGRTGSRRLPSRFRPTCASGMTSWRYRGRVGCRCVGGAAIRIPMERPSRLSSGAKASAGMRRSAARLWRRCGNTMATRSELTGTLARLPAAMARITACRTCDNWSRNSSGTGGRCPASGRARNGAGMRGASTRAARRLVNARKAWLRRTSRKLAERAGTVVIERLNTKGMTRSARGIKEDPGKNVRQKAGLNREILNTGWSAMEQMLDCRALEVIRVPAAHTSQTCSACGVVDADSRRSQESFKCVACDHAQNADLNAARNILASATGASARRGGVHVSAPRDP